MPSNIQEAAERRAHETAHVADKMDAHPDSELNKLDEEAMRTIAKESPKKVCAYVRVSVCAPGTSSPLFSCPVFRQGDAQEGSDTWTIDFLGHVDSWTLDFLSPCVCRIVLIFFLIPKEVGITLLLIPILIPK